jgi:ferric-dicitrate binding protein FerR (iron transport regulator)
MKSVSKRGPKSFSRLMITAVCLSIWLCTPASVLGQSLGCVLVPDGRNPSEKILRCGSNLTIRSAPNTAYRLTSSDNRRQPGGARLDSGALLIEFTPNEGQRDFRILTPQAITAVRGTRWAVEVGPSHTSTLVLSGSVEVTRRSSRRGAAPGGRQSAVLGAGEGVDVPAGAGPIVVQRWAQTRIDALMVRFGQ